MYTLSFRINCENSLFFAPNVIETMQNYALFKQSEPESDSMKTKTDLFQWNMRWWIEFSFNEKDIPTKGFSEKRYSFPLKIERNVRIGNEMKKRKMRTS